MKSNFNIDIKFYADKVLDVLCNSLSKYTDKYAGKDSGSSGGRGQGRCGGRASYGAGSQRKSSCISRR